ncbi:histidinol phosphate phosphatase [Synergistales bacterium]|nr:histidinol phosphate phosphatase [Synergistales bacterium]
MSESIVGTAALGRPSLIYDSHVHSRNSHDGRDSVDALCEAAIAKGLAGIAITDHCDAARDPRGCVKVKDAVVRDVRAARGRFGDALMIAAGVELGEPHRNIATAKEIASDPDLDFVIGSLHMLRDTEDFYYIDYDREDLDCLLRRYYDELTELCECGVCDVVGHINYQARYMNARQRARVDWTRYYPELEKVLSSCARRGMGMEINTSGLRAGVGDTLPGADAIKMFKDAGGRIITIGSDAHTAEAIGSHARDAADSIAAAGFSAAFFIKRAPGSSARKIQ